MSAVAPVQAVPGRASATLPPLTLPAAVELRVPLCFVVEPDALWAERALDALLEAHAAAAACDAAAPEPPVARWTRARGWTSYRATYGFGLGGAEEPAGRADALEEVLRLADHLASARHGDGPHPFEGALFSMRGLEHALGHRAAAEVLREALLQLRGCGATLLVELAADPAETMSGALLSLGPVLRLSIRPLLLYENAITDVRAAAAALGSREPDLASVVDALGGLSRLQAELAGRILRAECRRVRRGTDVLALLDAARGCVEQVLAGIPR